MKVTETINKQDGTTETRQINIPFEKGNSAVCFTLVPTTDEPISVKIVEAGWYDGGPTFHIVTEYGDFYQSDYDFGSLEHVLAKWPEFEKIWNEVQPDVIVSSKTIKDIPNDQELGRWIRTQTSNSQRYRKDISNPGQLELNFNM